MASRRQDKLPPAILSTCVDPISRLMTQATHICPPLARQHADLLPPLAPLSPSHLLNSVPLPSHPSMQEHGICGTVLGFAA